MCIQLFCKPKWGGSSLRRKRLQVNKKDLKVSCLMIFLPVGLKGIVNRANNLGRTDTGNVLTALRSKLRNNQILQRKSIECHPGARKANS